MEIKNIINYFLSVVFVLLHGCSTPAKTIVAFTSSSSSLSSIRTIAVLPFVEPIQKSARSAHLGTIIDERNPGVTLANKISEKLLLSGRFNVIERSAIGKVIEEQRLSTSDLFDQRNAISLGRLIGVDSVVIGEVQRAETFVRLGSHCWRLTATIRLVDIRTGEVLMISNIDRGRETEGVSMEDTTTAVIDKECGGIVDQLLNKLRP